MSNPYGGNPDPRWSGYGYPPGPDQSAPNHQGYPPYPNPQAYGRPYPSQPPYRNQPPYPNQPYPGTVPTSSAQPERSFVQRPAVIGISASMTVTASLMWLVLLAFGLLVAASIKSQFSYSEQPDAAIYHIADEFQVVMGNGLGLWLFGLPLLAAVSGFLLLVRRPWARISYSLLGALSVGWSLYWLHDKIGWWVPTASYIALAVGICWAPSVGRWHADAARQRAQRDQSVSR